jgi:CRP/FNR family cyclic AMP-dependent transcriptional regulator
MTTEHDPFSMPAFLASVGVVRTLVEYRRGDTIFTQGDACEHIWHIESGTVKLSVSSAVGKQAVVAMLGPGDFLGETCLAGVPSHVSSATAITRSALIILAKKQMLGLLRAHHALSDRFIAHLLARNLRVEEDLIDHLFNSIEKRLARTLLLLARYTTQETSDGVVPHISQDTLAAMIGTTRSRVNLFLQKFKRQGFIAYDSGRPLTVHRSLLTIVLRE